MLRELVVALKVFHVPALPTSTIWKLKVAAPRNEGRATFGGAAVAVIMLAAPLCYYLIREGVHHQERTLSWLQPALLVGANYRAVSSKCDIL